MKKYLKLLRFEVSTFSKSALIFYCVMLGIQFILGFSVTFVTDSGSTNISSEILFPCMIYFGVFASLGFFEDFKFLMQNCYTRLEIFISQLGLFFTAALMFSVVNFIVLELSYDGSRLAFNSLLRYAYQDHLTMGTEIALMVLLSLFVATLVYAVTVLFQRFNKKIVGLAVALVFVALNMIIIAAIRYLPSDTLQSMMDFAFMLAGFNNGNVNPSIALLTVTVLIVINAGIAWLLLRRTELK